MKRILWVSLALAGCAAGAAAQLREVPAPSGLINVSFTEPTDAGQAERLRELAARLKPVSDQLEALEAIDILVVHTQRELDQRLGPGREGAFSGATYIHGILFLTPPAWQRAATPEALEDELREALVRYTVVRLAGGNRVPYWLEEGLVAHLTHRPVAPASAEVVLAQGPLALTSWESGDFTPGYWAVRWLVEERGGLAPVRQLLRVTAQRPDTFVENLQLIYGQTAGELERAWRAWLEKLVAEEKRKREGGVQVGPLKR